MDVRVTFDESDPPTGVVAADDNEAEPFVGWLGLFALLERTVAASAPDAAD